MLNIKKQAEVSDSEEDRLSNLPEGIITHILSFLSTTESVRTSILSTRWKYIWSSVPTLKLRCLEFHSNARRNFLNVVDRMLMGHSQHFLENVYIEDFYSEIDDGSRIQSWICAAIKRNVRKLELVHFWPPKQPHELHLSLFTCKNLVVLKLNLGMVLNFPISSTCFPSLKILKLDSVIYKDDTSAQNLISSCPVLEDLSISIDGNVNLQTLNVMSRPLKKFEIRSIGDDELHIRKIVIDAPALEFLVIADNVTTLEYVVRDLSSIISVRLYVFTRCYEDSNSYVTCLYEQFIKRIFNVKFLHLSSSTLLSLSLANSYDLPTFHNLTYLKFFDDSSYDDNDDDDDDCWNSKLVMEFLKNSPVLEVLIFDRFNFSRSTPSEWDIVPCCFISHLKTIEMKGNIYEDTAEKIRYFLKKARVLEKLTIKPKYSEDLKYLKIDWEDILKHPKGSMAWSDRELVISFV